MNETQISDGIMSMNCCHAVLELNLFRSNVKDRSLRHVRIAKTSSVLSKDMLLQSNAFVNTRTENDVVGRIGWREERRCCGCSTRQAFAHGIDEAHAAHEQPIKGSARKISPRFPNGNPKSMLKPTGKCIG